MGEEERFCQMPWKRKKIGDLQLVLVPPTKAGLEDIDGSFANLVEVDLDLGRTDLTGRIQIITVMTCRRLLVRLPLRFLPFESIFLPASPFGCCQMLIKREK